MKQILINRYVPILICAIISINLFGQVKTRIYDNGIPSNLLPTKSLTVNELEIKAPAELDNLLQSSKGEVNKSIEYDNKFALPQSVNINFLRSANFFEDKYTLIYSLTVRAEKAINISTQFKEFKLSPNAVLSIYTENELTDSITAKENNENNIWATRVYQGNILNIVLKLPKSEIGLSNFTISQISFGYKKYGGEYFGSPGLSAPCNINVLCPQGNGWQNERSAVVFLLVADGAGTCTGSMIMNTCNTNIPYLLTANHCLVGNLNNWVFQYQYWSTTCSPNTGGREDIQFNGCTLRANNAISDFALVQMNQTPPANLGITYAGWNRSATPAANTVEIHHPASDLMKISLDANAPVAISWPGIPGLTHWRAHFQQGTVQPGSSGSPLFDQNHRIIGQCHGDQNNAGNYCTQQISECGRFDASWTGGGTNATRLSNWLDPNNTGAIFTNTTNRNLLAQPNQGFQPFSLIKQYNNQSCNEINVIASGIPNGVSITWSTTNGALINGNPSPFTTSSNSVLISANLSTTITAVIQNGTCTFSSSSSFCPCEPWDNPVINWIYSAPATNEPLQAEVSPAHPDAIRYEWYINGQLVETTYGTFLSTYNWPCTSEGEGLSVIAITSCGASAPVYGGTYSPICYQYRTSSNVKLYPNPASTQVIVKLEDLNSKTTNGQKVKVTSTLKSIIQIKIIDKMGVTKRVLKFSSGNSLSTINVSDLPSDIYYLDITDGNTQVRKPLIIRR